MTHGSPLACCPMICPLQLYIAGALIKVIEHVPVLNGGSFLTYSWSLFAYSKASLLKVS